VTSVLVLDSEPVSLLAAKRYEGTTNRVRAFMQAHLDRGGLVVVPANVIAETRRGARASNVDWVLDAHLIVDVDRAIAAQAGAILETAKRSSADLADATVAATAALARATSVFVLTSERPTTSGPNDIETFVEPWRTKVIVKAISTL